MLSKAASLEDEEDAFFGPQVIEPDLTPGLLGTLLNKCQSALVAIRNNLALCFRQHGEIASIVPPKRLTEVLVPLVNGRVRPMKLRPQCIDHAMDREPVKDQAELGIHRRALYGTRRYNRLQNELE